MKTSWKSVCQKLKMKGPGNNRGREGSDTSFTSSNSDLDTITNNSTPIFDYSRSPSGNEWQMNLSVSRKDDPSKQKKEKKNDVKPPVSPKVDTNLVKLKMLEASRRARMRRQAFTQTEPVKTKMLKDEKIDNQADLIGNRNQTTETDENFLTFKTKDGEFIVTSTRAVNTEKVLTEGASTQTYMPRSKHSVHSFDDDELSDNENADRPTCELKKIEKRFRSLKGPSTKQNKNLVLKRETIETFSVEPSRQQYNDESDDSLEDYGHSTGKKRSYSSQPNEKIELPRNYFQDGPTPWSNFHDMMLGQRFLNARLSPVPRRQQRQFPEPPTWSGPQLQILTGLMDEANSLLEMFDQVAMLLGPDVKLHDVTDVKEFVLPPKKYDEAILNSCKELEDRLRNIKTEEKYKLSL